MCNYKYFTLVVLCLFSISTIESREKSDSYKPKWITHKLPESKSGTYTFISTYGEGVSLDAARQKALVNLSTKLEVERGIKVNSVLRSNMKETFSSIENENGFWETTELDMVVEERGKQLNIICRVIDEYWEKDRQGYKIYVLYTVTDSRSQGASFNDKIIVTSKYGAAGLFSIVPGAGQFYKGATMKGAMFVIGEVAAVAGIILCENTRASYRKKMIEQPKYAVEYNSRMDNWETARNVCIGVAGAVYVVNLIDALCTKGAKYIKVKQNSKNVSIRPYADANSVGLSLAF